MEPLFIGVIKVVFFGGVGYLVGIVVGRYISANFPSTPRLLSLGLALCVFWFLSSLALMPLDLSGADTSTVNVTLVAGFLAALFYGSGVRVKANSDDTDTGEEAERERGETKAKQQQVSTQGTLRAMSSGAEEVKKTPSPFLEFLRKIDDSEARKKRLDEKAELRMKRQNNSAGRENAEPIASQDEFSNLDAQFPTYIDQTLGVFESKKESQSYVNSVMKRAELEGDEARLEISSLKKALAESQQARRDYVTSVKNKAELDRDEVRKKRLEEKAERKAERKKEGTFFGRALITLFFKLPLAVFICMGIASGLYYLMQALPELFGILQSKAGQLVGQLVGQNIKFK